MANEKDYEKQFEELATGLEIEKAYDRLATRAEFIRALAMHCGDIYQAARDSGLPRGVSERMAMEYFEYELKPTPIVVMEGGQE